MLERYLSTTTLNYICQRCRSVNITTNMLAYNKSRRLHLAAAQHQRETGNIVPDPPLNPKTDWVGPPDPKSNIRPYKFYIPEDETKWQKEFRLRREDNRKWNHDFWLEHNDSFFKKKEEFVKKKLESQSHTGDETKTLSPEEMSEFYKAFLDEKYKVHLQYNKDWYKRNISLLWPALKASVEKAWRRKSSSS